jgi:hypothetical protein
MAALGAGEDRRRALRERVLARNLTLSLSRGSVNLKQSHVELLVGSLRKLPSLDGDAVADEIEDLALAGVRIDLRLQPIELEALASAVICLTEGPRPADPAFARLLVCVREAEAR